MESANLDPTSLSMQELIDAEATAQEERQQIKLITEIIRRKPLVDYVDKLGKPYNILKFAITSQRKSFKLCSASPFVHAIKCALNSALKTNS